MKYLFILIAVFIVFNGCKKSDGNSAPVIKFKSITSQYNSSSTSQPLYLTIKVKDEDGDLGMLGNDSSLIFVKNITNPPFKIDSFLLPSNVPTAGIKNIEFELETNIAKNSSNGSSVLGPRRTPNQAVDTMYFEVYVKDFKKNKSNVLKTSDPLYYSY
jgi:hypothetical protein